MSLFGGVEASCPSCGGPVVRERVKGRDKTYCSPTCRRREYRRRKRGDADFPPTPRREPVPSLFGCRWCGGELTDKPLGRRRVYCADRCRRQAEIARRRQRRTNTNSQEGETQP